PPGSTRLHAERIQPVNSSLVKLPVRVENARQGVQPGSLSPSIVPSLSARLAASTGYDRQAAPLAMCAEALRWSFSAVHFFVVSDDKPAARQAAVARVRPPLAGRSSLP